MAVTALGLGAAALGGGCTGSTGNHDPLLTTLDPIRISVGERKQMTVTAADDDNDDIEFRFQLTLFPGDPANEQAFNQNLALERGMKWIAASTTAIFEWGPSPNHVGEHTLTIVADDRNGGIADATAAVTVIAGQEQGSPRFESHPNLVLDLARTQSLRARVAVDDPDSIEVEISLEGAPEGMEIKALIDSGKQAQIEWTPEREQLQDRNVFTFFAVADDGEHQPVKQRMSVVIRRAKAPGGGGGNTGGAEGCPQNMAAPTIDPVPVTDQSGNDDFVVEAAIRDAETEISDAFVSFSWHSDPTNFPCYISTSLLPAEEDTWIASIPRAADLVDEAPEGCDPIDLSAPVRFYYYLCAWDSDDPNREESDPDSKKCDNAWCAPNESQFSFVWSPGAGGGQCPDDAFDDGGGNDSKESPAAIDSGEGFALVLCPGDEDWYAVRAQAGDTLVVGVAFDGDGGNLSVQAFAPDGSPAGAPQADLEDGYELIEIPGAVDGVYTFSVTGEGVGEGGEVYNFIVRREAGGGAGAGNCPADPGEPNDALASATPIEPGASGPYGLCGPADIADWYSVQAGVGARIIVDLQFAHRADGDLDLELWPPGAGQRVARGFSATDNERVEFVANAAGAWTIGVIGFRGAVNTYRLQVSVGGAGGNPGGGEEPGEGGEDPPADPVCASDGGAEPNNGSATAGLLNGPLPCATIQEGDEDWWRVDVQPMQGFTANVGFIDADGDIDVEVYAADGTTLLLIAQSVNDNETVVFPGASQGGAIFMKVLLYDGDDNTYSIALNKHSFGLGPVGTCPQDHQEPNDARATARTVTLRQESATRRALTWCGDEDWYRVHVPVGGSHVLAGELVYVTSESALTVELVNGEGQPIGTVTPGADGRIEIESRHPGTNYMRVTGGNGGPGAGLYWFEFVTFLEV